MVRKAKEYPIPVVDTVFTFKTESEKALWESVLTVQLKDGQYKDGWWGSHKHEWMYYVNAKTQVGEVTKLENLPAGVIKLTGFSRMIPFIGTQMTAVLKEIDPKATVEDVRKYLQDISRAIRDAGPSVVSAAPVIAAAVPQIESVPTPPVEASPATQVLEAPKAEVPVAEEANIAPAAIDPAV
jgi:hypothetical protein